MADQQRKADKPEGETGGQARLPILYQNPVVVTPEAFGMKSFVPATDYGYARSAHLVPINAPQMIDAATSFPVLFTATSPTRLIALLGVRAGENLFVDADGAWSSDFAIPDYIRRYPFILRPTSEPRGYVVCADLASPMIVDDDSRPFFRDGEQSEMLKEITQTCINYQRQSEFTGTLAKAIAESGILGPPDDALPLPGGRKFKLDGFRIVDKKKLDALPDETFASWRTNGYLDFIYLHLVSIRTWHRLLGRMARRRAAEKAADGTQRTEMAREETDS
jgi:hypothetical protein